jgi:endonuclease-3
MGSASKTAQFAKLSKVLKKHYKPAALNAQRTVLQHLLFACVLEDAPIEAAEEAYAALEHTFFDWNEVRVTSVAELSEVMARLPDPRAAANRLKRILHAIFEAAYSFDLEDKRKKNLGPTQTWFEKLDGATRFTTAYVTQAALGGHSIPIDTGTMQVLQLLDCVSEKEAAAGAVPGLERAIAKSKGVEFGLLLHQIGAEFTANPYAPKVREILLEINPEIAERLPKRRAPRPAEPAAPAAPPAEAAKPAEPGGGKKKAEPPTSKAPAAKPVAKPPSAPAAKPPAAVSPSKPAVPSPTAKTPAAPAAKPAAPPASKPPAAKPPAAKPPVAKPSVPVEKAPPPKKKPAADRLALAKTPPHEPPKKKPTPGGLAKKKPR